MMKEMRVPAIANGTVIDHIPPNVTLKIVDILDVHRELLTIGMNLESSKYRKKGIIKIADKFLTEEETNKIAIIAPTATINIINDYNQTSKFSPKLPEFVEGIVRCTNPNCITNNEQVRTKFWVVDKENIKIKCNYCERVIGRDEIEIK